MAQFVGWKADIHTREVTGLNHTDSQAKQGFEPSFFTLTCRVFFHSTIVLKKTLFTGESVLGRKSLMASFRNIQ